MIFLLCIIIQLICVFIKYTLAYGSAGHMMIGEVTWETLSNETKTNMQMCKFLEPFNGSMGKASIWADLIKRNPKYRWTSAFHYYDIDGNPPLYCGRFEPPFSNTSINLYNGMKRALQNYTRCENHKRGQDVLCCGSTFHNGMVTHLLQDMHQPLHLVGKSRGGNEEFFEKDGKRYNLHRFWDSDVVELLLQDMSTFNYTNASTQFVKEVKRLLPLSDCPTRGKNTRDDILHYIFKKSQETLNVNCDLIWHTERHDYIKASIERTYTLMLDSMLLSNCVFTYLYG